MAAARAHNAELSAVDACVGLPKTKHVHNAELSAVDPCAGLSKSRHARNAELSVLGACIGLPKSRHARNAELSVLGRMRWAIEKQARAQRRIKRAWPHALGHRKASTRTTQN